MSSISLMKLTLDRFKCLSLVRALNKNRDGKKELQIFEKLMFGILIFTETVLEIRNNIIVTPCSFCLEEKLPRRFY